MSGHDLSGIRYSAEHSHKKDRIAIIVSKWNSTITEVLKEGAIQCLLEAGVKDKHIYVHYVPGSYELPSGANYLLYGKPKLTAVICLGCVIQGETKHFDFISDAVAQGIMKVGLTHRKPVIFGVLTPDTLQQAKDRAGGKYGNKGIEAAVSCLEMIDLRREAFNMRS
ncbi:MAG: 6,7-dimethyl-8-ribityllumazine synthase [Bacteroidota bacterium]